MELSSYLMIPEFPLLFISNSECLQMLSRVMKGEPFPADGSNSLQTVLFELFASFKNQPEDQILEIRKVILNSKALDVLLIHLANLCSVDHRKPGK